MNKSTVLGIAVAMLIGAGVGFGYYQYSHQEPGSDHASEKTASTLEVTPIPPPSERYPVSPSTTKRANKPLPQLDASDLTLEEELISLIGKPLFEKIFVRTEILKRLVTTVEAASEEGLPPDFLPFHAIASKFKTIKKGEKLFLDPKNSERYRDYVRLAETTDLKKLAEIYQTFYPLIDSAYHEINAQGHFNDRLVEIIDLLISTPEASAQLELVALNKSFQYADPKFEELSASQKILIRMGQENSKRIKASLSKLRNTLILGQ